MQIALDGLPLCRELTGIGHYTLELGLHLAAENQTDHFSIIAPRRFVSVVNGTSTPENLELRRATLNPVIRYWWRRGLSKYLRRKSIDVFHGTNFKLPRDADCATVVTIHDLSTLLHPDTHESHNVASARANLPWTAHAATLIVTPTENIGHEIEHHLSIPREKIVAIPLAPRSCFEPAAPDEAAAIRKRFSLGNEFLLYVGTVEPRKNLLNLVLAFEQSLTRFPDLQLVIAGRKGWKVDDLLAYVKRSAISNRIISTGYLSDAELKALYSSCTLFVYPSIYEGFGLPPIEAMRCGAPVITSAIPSIAEVVGNGARLVKPDDYQLLTKAIEELLSDRVKREELASLGHKRAQEFSWSRTAKRMRDVFEEAVQRHNHNKKG